MCYAFKNSRLHCKLAIGLCLLCSKIYLLCFLEFPQIFTYYASFYAFWLTIMLFVFRQRTAAEYEFLRHRWIDGVKCEYFYELHNTQLMYNSVITMMFLCNVRISLWVYSIKSSYCCRLLYCSMMEASTQSCSERSCWSLKVEFSSENTLLFSCS